MLMVLNNYQSVYETDILSPIFNIVKSHLGDINIKYLRIVTDHIRCSIYLVSSGILPGNTGREYVLRKLLRKIYSIIYIKVN